MSCTNWKWVPRLEHRLRRRDWATSTIKTADKKGRPRQLLVGSAPGSNVPSTCKPRNRIVVPGPPLYVERHPHLQRNLQHADHEFHRCNKAAPLGMRG